MFHKLSAIAAAAFLFTSGAQAAVIDFVAEAAGNERGELGDGSYSLQNANTGGVKITFKSSDFVYFDDLSGGKPGGLGVCGALDGNDQCNPSSDDNISAGEWVELLFDMQVDLADLVFHDKDHNNITNSLGALIIDGVETTFAAASSKVFSHITSIKFQYADNSNRAKQFYISSLTVGDGGTLTTVPVPASLPLLLGGVGFLAWRSRRKAA